MLEVLHIKRNPLRVVQQNKEESNQELSPAVHIQVSVRSAKSLGLHLLQENMIVHSIEYSRLLSINV